jgi:lambda family phage tail tape measure protein
MAKEIGNIELKFDVTGLEDLTNLSRQLKNLSKIAKPAAGSFKGLINGIKDVTKFTPKTISQFKQKERTLKALRNEVKAGGVAFKKLGREIDANRIKLQSFNQTAKKGTGFGKKIGTGFGSILASQVLPGNTSQLALAGANIAGPKGALIGAAIGAGMDFSGLAKDAAVFAGNIKRLEVALKGVTKTQEEFAKAQRVIASVSDGLNVPIANATKQFTTLSASVIGAGGSVNDAELVFRGVSEAIKATGGDAEDVKSAIRAMSQIFGKGKVSAEELQGQLGERLPGAVVKFAQATGRTLPQLQKDLRDGTVGLNDVMKFVVKLSGDHASAAREMADSTADAGQRMQVALDKLKLSFGEFFQPIGAGFQDIITGMVNMLNAALETRNILKMIQLEEGKGVAGSVANKALRDAEETALKIAKLRAGVYTEEDYKKGNVHSLSIGKQKPIDENLFRTLRDKMFKDNLLGYAYNEGILSPPVTSNDLTNFMSPTGDDDGKYYQTLQKQLDFIQKARDAEKKAEDEKYSSFLDFQLLSGQITQTKFDQIKLDQQAVEISKELGINLEYVKEVLTQAADKSFNFAEEFAKISEKATDLKSRVGELALDVTDRLGNAFADFFTTGKMGFADLARSAIQELNRIIIKAAFMKFVANPILGALNLNAKGNVFSGGEVVPSAKGNVFAQNKIVPYAYGGIVSKPTLFPMANGAGLMGEAGPEAIMPLKRGRNGKLGVIAQGGGVGNIVVNVDASGSSVEGNSQQSAELGRMLGAVVQAELIKQKRPGGLLG